MDSSLLTPEQLAQLRAPVGRQLDYLNKLCGRLQIRVFPTDDPLWMKALKARAVVQDLYSETGAPTLPPDRQDGQDMKKPNSPQGLHGP